MRQMIIMLGAPGSGKGTQARMVFEKYGYPQISTGDILRQAVRAGTDMGRRAKTAMDAGELVADAVVIGIIEERLQEPDCRDGCILDGFPRTVEQAEALEHLTAAEFKLRVLYFDVPLEDLVKRLTGRRTCTRCGEICNIHFAAPQRPDQCDRCNAPLMQRDDDREEVVRRRLAVYAEQTSPLIGFYRRRNVLVDLPAAGDVRAIFDNVVRAIQRNGD